MKDYEASAAYVDSLLRAVGWKALPPLLEVMDPAAKPMVENPFCEPWHPALHLEAFGAAVVQVQGAQPFEELTYRAMKDRFGAIVLPMLKKSLETTNRSPAAIFSKLGGIVEVAIRGMDIGWRLYDEGTGGILVFRYPRPVAAHVDLSWRGMLRFVFEQTQATGRISDFNRSDDGQLLEYRLEW